MCENELWCPECAVKDPEESRQFCMFFFVFKAHKGAMDIFPYWFYKYDSFSITTGPL